jgi:outer membrane protein OmpA-like peptidoglycan-associated protein
MAQHVVADASSFGNDLKATGHVAVYGIGPRAPVASNDSDDGRATNRRVELVKQ